MPVSWEWWLLAGGGLACLLVLLLLRVPRRVGRRLPGPPGPAPPFAAEPETPRRPELVLVAAPPDGAPSWVVVPLGEGELVLGRNRELCQVHFPHRAVSGTHARIRRRDGRWHLEDLHSKNHTYLNKERVTTAVPLRAGDLIEFSGYALRFEPGAAERGAGDPTVMDSRVEAALGPLSSRQVLEAQREEGLAALLEIAEDLGRHLEVSELLPRVAERLLALFRRADRCLVLRWVPADEQFRAEQVRGRGAQPPRECFSQTIARRCLETGQAFLCRDTYADASLNRLGSVAEGEIRSVMTVPLVLPRGEAWGAIQLDSRAAEGGFTEEDARLLMGVAGQVEIVLENARLHAELAARARDEYGLELAREVQDGFLPREHLPVEGYAFFTYYEPLRAVGSDYYDFVPLPGGRVAVLLADVPGRGVPAALLMARVSAEARFWVRAAGGDLAAAVGRLNDQLCRADVGDHYVRLAAAVLDPAAHRVELVTAGHEPPLLYRGRSGQVEEAVPEEARGYPLRSAPELTYASAALELEPGDSVLLFTDGLCDARDARGRRFGREGIARVLAAAEAPGTEAPGPVGLGERVTEAVRLHAHGRPLLDEIVLVCFGRLRPGTPDTATLRVLREE